MTDNYLGFTYNGIHSYNSFGQTGFQAYILNEGEDLKFSNAPSFSNEFSFPKFGESSVLLGVNKENREISLTLFVKEVSLASYRKFVNWLKPSSTPEPLFFDYDSSFEYKVVVNSIGDGNFTINKNCSPGQETYNVEVEVSFTTVGDYAAIYRNQATFSFDNTSILASGGLNVDDYANIEYNGVNLILDNNAHEDMYFVLEFTPTTGEDGIISLLDFSFNIEENKTYKYYSKYGIILDENNNFISTTSILKTIKIQSNSNSTIPFTFSGIDNSRVSIGLIIREVI